MHFVSHYHLIVGFSHKRFADQKNYGGVKKIIYSYNYYYIHQGAKAMTRKYSKNAQKEVANELHQFKHNKAKSGTKNKPVRNPKQAIAIALSKARKKGYKAPKKDNAK